MPLCTLCCVVQGVDDLMQRLEVGLFEHGFTNGNSIACINLCRDEVTQTLKHKVGGWPGRDLEIQTTSTRSAPTLLAAPCTTLLAAALPLVHVQIVRLQIT